MTLISEPLMEISLEELFPAFMLIESLHREPLVKLWEVLNAGRLWSGNVLSWLATTDLSCLVCSDYTVAQYVLGTWNQFNKQLMNQEFYCQCGGVLTNGTARVKLLA